MDFASVSGVAPLLGVLTPVLIVLAFGWAIWRAGSRQIVVRRLWQFVLGSQEIADPEVRAFVEDEASLMSFRLIAGVPVSSLEKARELIRWTRLHDVRMQRIRLCGDLFDPELRRVRTGALPSRFSQRLRLAWLAICLVVASLSLGGLFFNKAVMKLNATERFFLATATELGTIGSAVPFSTPTLRAGDCARPVGDSAKRSSFTEKEVGILCNLLQADESKSYFRNALSEQRWAFAQLLLVAAFFGWVGLFSWLAGAAAQNLAKQALDPALPAAA